MTTTSLRRVVSRPSVRLLLAAIALILAGRGSMRLILAQTNPIVQENNPSNGTSNNWDVSGAGDPTIQGFASDISVNTGQPVNFKVKTTASNYTIAIYRLGYYGGAGARLMTTLTRSTAQTQPACSVNGTTG